jgi:hypothetical protein
MLPEIPEPELIEKLITKGHLNAPERSYLPGGRARWSLVRAAIVRHVVEDGWFPKDLRPDDGFDGGLIERTPKGCRIHWKVECGVGRFALLRVTPYTDILEAVQEWVRDIFGDNIGEVKIDWEA